MTDLLSGLFVSGDDSFDSDLCPLHRLGVISDQEHVLLVIVIGLRNRARFLRALTSDQDLAACLFLETLLIQTFRSNDHANVVDASTLRNVDLPLYLI